MNKKVSKIVLGIIFGVSLLFFWSKFIDIEEMLNHLKKIKINFVIISGLFYLTAYFFRSLRWKFLVSPLKKISSIKMYLYWMAGNFTNYLIPIRAGEFLRCYLLKKEAGLPISKTLPSVFIDKMFDTLGILLILFLIPFLDISISKPLIFLITAVFIVFLIGITILFLSAYAEEKIVIILQKFFFFIPKKNLRDKIHNLIEYFVQGTALFKNHVSLLPIVSIFTFIAILLDTLFFLSLFYAFSTSIPFINVLFGYTLIYLSYIFPHPPAQIGSNEVIMILIFSVGMGFNKELVSAVMAFSHILTAFLITTIGSLALSWSGIKLSETLK